MYTHGQSTSGLKTESPCDGGKHGHRICASAGKLGREENLIFEVTFHVIGCRANDLELLEQRVFRGRHETVLFQEFAMLMDDKFELSVGKPQLALRRFFLQSQLSVGLHAAGLFFYHTRAAFSVCYNALRRNPVAGTTMR